MNLILIGSLLGFLGVVLGAFGAHGLKDILTPEMKKVYETGVFYHLIHAVMLVLTGCLATLKPGQTGFKTAGLAFLIGVILFSGSLYLLSLTDVKKWGMVTPLGGLAFLIGWLCLAFNSRS